MNKFEIENQKNTPLWWSKYFSTINPDLKYIVVSDHILLYRETESKISIGFKGPYGGINSTKDLNLSTIIEMYEELASFGKNIEVRLPPAEKFMEMHSLNLEAMQKLGFTIKYKEINQNLNTSLVSFNRNRLRDLKKSVLAGNEFKSCSIESAYNLISKNRQNKGIELSLKLEYFHQMLKLKRGVISSYSISNNGIDLSAAILFKVSNTYSYVYAWGHDQINPIGGITLSHLAFKLLSESNQNGINDISLGISSIYGQIDEGLYRFKGSLGATIEEITALEYAPKNSTL
jgi:hypothetical protein